MAATFDPVYGFNPSPPINTTAPSPAFTCSQRRINSAISSSGPAVIPHEELAQTLGINTRLVRFVTFCLGAGLASLAGALITPLVSVHPNLGVPWLINAFMLVLVAGVSLGNLALAALVLGGAQVLVSAYGNPVLGSLTIVILAVLILRFRTITI